MNQSAVIFSISVITFLLAIGGRVWVTASALAEMKHALEKQTIQLGHLADLHDAAFNGFRERIEHSTNRFKGEIEDLDRRLEDAEGFLTKTTEFMRRR